ncbi:MAG: glycosyltransferase, partial [Ilumatobacteraceae bacterium]
AVRLMGTPSVVLLHNLVDTVDLEVAGFGSNRAKLAVFRTIGRLLTRVVLKANRVAVTIPAYAELLADRYHATNVYLSPHGTFDVPGLLPVAPGARTRQLLTFGKFGTYKRVEPLIEAYRLLLDAGYDDVELVIAGTDGANSPDYLAGVRMANQDLPGLLFTGYVAEDDVAALFERSEMVVFPYTGTTGSSGPLHQAGAAGKAAVLPAIGDFIDVISEEGFAGETFTPGDAFSLAGAITRLLEDDDRRNALGRQNGLAARALPISDIADWHVLHMAALAG